MTIRMSLCPNCKTVQKDGDVCGLCTCPVNDKQRVLIQQEKQGGVPPVLKKPAPLDLWYPEV